ncbi:MAG: hypothetical protein ACOYOU_01015 [Kiritimatiellia bacterium]
MSAKGKISRLPFEIRQRLNARMRDGESDVDLVEWLNSIPEVGKALAAASFGGPKKSRPTISAQNISEYRAGGYAAWLRDQDHVENVKTLSEFSLRMAEACGGDVSRPAVAIAAGKIMQALELSDDLTALEMAKALASLSKAETAAARAKTDEARVGIQGKALALEQDKFERNTCVLFIKWYADKRAQEIADGKGTVDVKVDQLRSLMFGEDKGESS